MRTQLRYELKYHQSARLIWLGGAMLINLLLLAFFSRDGIGTFGYIFSIVIASLVLSALMVYAIVQVIDVFKRMYQTPHSYMTFLPPVPAKHIVLSRAVVILLDTVLPFVIGLAWLLIHIFMRETPLPVQRLSPDVVASAVCLGLLGVLQYFLLLSMLFFIPAFIKRFIPYLRARTLLGIALFFVLSAVLNYPALPLSLLPSVAFEAYAFVMLVNLPIGLNGPTIAYFVIIAAEIVALYIGACKLMDSKLNL